MYTEYVALGGSLTSYVPPPEEVQARRYAVERGRVAADGEIDHGSGRAHGCRERPGIVDDADVVGGPGTVEGNRSIFIDGLIRAGVRDGRCPVGGWGQGARGGSRQQRDDHEDQHGRAGQRSLDRQSIILLATHGRPSPPTR